jgi:aspartyl-tRNA(Asn)/glutamyl-tRNA(Gln) amidotransferase subunit A
VVSRYGMIAFASSLDQAGPMAQVGRGLRAAAQRHGRLRRARLHQPGAPAEDYARDLEQPLAGLRIGLPKEFFGEGHGRRRAPAVEPHSPNTASSAPPRSRSACRIRPLGAGLLRDRAGRSQLQPVALRRRALRPPRAEYGDLNDMYCKSRAQGFGAEVKRRILIGTYVLSHGYYDAYYLRRSAFAADRQADFRAPSTAAT